MTVHIVVTEGLVAEDTTPEETYFLSDYKVLISPGNRFGCATSEEDYATQYLRYKRPVLNVKYPQNIQDRTYLDTFDNARLLRKWLDQEQCWPIGDIILYCNAPHLLRSWAMFQLCGFNVKQVIGTRPETVERQMVYRLWFYDYFLIQILYEFVAFIYDFCRCFVWRVNGSR